MSELVAASPADARSPVRDPIRYLPDPTAGTDPDAAAIVLTCANCGALMDERKCKLICRCGDFASCSDYY